MKRKALFLDRDGVINVDYGYVNKQQDCVFVDGIFDLVRLANEVGYQVVVVTNQAGIGRGYFSETQFMTFMDWMHGVFADRGAKIDRVYFCPHHPVAGLGSYRQACSCRKPQPGMLHEAQRDLDLDMSASLIIGDRLSDLEAGARAGVGRGFLFVRDQPEDEVPVSTVTVISSLSDVRSALEVPEICAGRAKLSP